MDNIQIGKYNNLEVKRRTEIGYYLGEGETDILMPWNCLLDESFEVGDTIKVFVYKDYKNRLIATQEKPHGTVGEFASMEVVDVNRTGAFLDWGVGKQLMVPYREQARPMNIGERHVVYITLDTRTERPVGISKLGSFFNRDTSGLSDKQEVELMVFSRTDAGYSCVIDGEWKGLLYNSEVYKPLAVGDKVKGYIKQVREDGLVDLTLRKPGYDEGSIEHEAQQLLGVIFANGGRLPFHDKTPPEVIKKELHMSKKQFKKLVGFLLKRQLIELSEEGIVIR